MHKRRKLEKKVNVYILQEKEQVYKEFCDKQGIDFTDLGREGVRNQSKNEIKIPQPLKHRNMKKIPKQVTLTTSDYLYVHIEAERQKLKVTDFVAGCIDTVVG